MKPFQFIEIQHNKSFKIIKYQHVKPVDFTGIQPVKPFQNVSEIFTNCKQRPDPSTSDRGSFETGDNTGLGNKSRLYANNEFRY